LLELCIVCSLYFCVGNRRWAFHVFLNTLRNLASQHISAGELRQPMRDL
jgi:hypothetical protein